MEYSNWFQIETFNRYICNRKEPWGRRIVWLFFTSFGLLYTGIIIYKNVSLYQGNFFLGKLNFQPLKILIFQGHI